MYGQNQKTVSLTMTLYLRLCLLILLCLASNAHAGGQCYTIYTPDNKVAFQSSTAPVDTALPYSQTVGKLFPGHHMVVTPTNFCPEISPAEFAAKLGLAPPLVAPSFLARAEDFAPRDKDEHRYFDRYGGGSYSGGSVSSSARTPRSDVHVRGYTRSDGTQVRAHTRAAPGRGR